MSWRGGITAVMKTGQHGRIPSGFQCELHTTIYQALEQVQIHASLALPNSEFFEMLYPFDDFQFGTHSQLSIVDGMVQAPTGARAWELTTTGTSSRTTQWRSFSAPVTPRRRQ